MKNNSTTLKNVAYIYVLAAIVIGFGIGYATRNTLNRDRSDSHSDSPSHSTSTHAKNEIKGTLVPKVEIIVTEDSKSGWNIRTKTENFKFTPENIGKENIEGEGHAHLYIDDVKVARLYGEYHHYDGKFDGTKTFKVTLNANDHSEYTKDNKVIDASLVVTHSHD